MMKINMVQFEPRRLDTAYNVDRMIRMTGGCSADVFLFPELATSGYLFAAADELEACCIEPGNDDAFRKLQELARDRNAAVCFGFPERCGDKIYNSSAFIYPEGNFLLYRKSHLFYREKELFTPGDTGFNVFEFRKVKLGMIICFDWIFPESIRTLALGGAQVILHCANLVLPYCQDAMVTRALENRVFVFTSNRTGTETVGEESLTFTGKSQAVGPDGKRILEFPVKGEAVKVVEIDPALALDKKLNEFNDLFADRREELYYNKQ